MDTDDVRSAARQAGDHPALETAARLGYAVNGVLHLLIAWLGFQLALGAGSGSADQSGALQTLSGTGVGRASLWIGVLGFLGLGLWQVTEVFVSRDETSDRVKAAAKAVLYLFLSFSCLTWARGSSGSSSSTQTVDFTATLMEKPAGRVLVGLVGLGIVAVGVYHVAKGWRRTFLKDLDEHPGALAERAGRFGYIAKGVALALVGILFALAALHAAPSEATGLDGALRTMLKAPQGPILLAVGALGFAAYAVYSFARARHAKV